MMTNRKMVGLIAVTTIIYLSVSNCLATSFGPPTNRTVKSPNGEVELRIKAKSGRHVIYKGSRRLWSFKKEVWHNDYFVSNDGKYVMWVAWEFVSFENLDEAALIIFSADGEILRKSFSEVSTPRRYQRGEVGPIGDFWRIWRGKIEQENDLVKIEVAGRNTLAIIDFSNLASSGRAEEKPPARRTPFSVFRIRIRPGDSDLLD